MMRNIKDNLEKSIHLDNTLPPEVIELAMVLDKLTDLGRFADLLAANIRLNVKQAQSLLGTKYPMKRIIKIKGFLNQQLE